MKISIYMVKVTLSITHNKHMCTNDEFTSSGPWKWLYSFLLASITLTLTFTMNDSTSEDEQNGTPPKTSMIDGCTFFHCFAGYCCRDLSWTTVSLLSLGFSALWLEWYWWPTGSPSHPIHAPTLASTTIMRFLTPSAWTLALLHPVAVSGHQMVPLSTMGQLWKTRV